jgi:hypothetical protein
VSKLTARKWDLLREARAYNLQSWNAHKNRRSTEWNWMP